MKPRHPKSKTINKTWLRLGVVASAIGLGAACGARTGLESGPPLPPGPECFVDEDCPTFGDLCNPVTCEPLVAADAGPTPDGGVPKTAKSAGGKCVLKTPVDCDDKDPCTKDTCDPDTGLCHYGPSTLDLDGDGFRGPLPGHKAGDMGSCGNDCDDTDPNTHPGAPEICDGKDNDCDGIADNNATFIPLDADAVRIDGDLAPATSDSIAWSGKSYVAIYSGTNQGFDVYEQLISPSAQKMDPPGEVQVTIDNADGDGGRIVWIGDRYGLAWQDRRDGDYEMYFTLLDQNGAKVRPDTRLTNAGGFSINGSIGWNGTEFLVAWQDQRNGEFEIFAQRVSVDGIPIGDNIQLTNPPPTGDGNESPTLAVGVKGVGLVFAPGSATQHDVAFQVWNPDLSMPVADPITLTDGTTAPVYPTAVFNKDRYVIAWYDTKAFPAAIYGAVVGEDGKLIVPPRALTDPGPFHSRYPFLRGLGDRLLLIYSDDRDQNNGYEIYTHAITANLDSMGPEQRITNAPGQSVDPVATFGPMGNIGILFRDDRLNGAHHVFFTRLTCAIATP